MARELRVTIVGNAADLERTFARASAATETFGAKMRGVGSSIESAGKKLTSAVTLPVIAAGGYAIDLGVKFEEAMQQIRTSAGASQAEVDRMSKALLELAKTAQGGGESPEALAKGLFLVESAGIRGGAALKILSAAAIDARVTGADLTEVVDVLTSAMKVHIAGTESATKAMGTLNAIVGAGKMHMSDLTGALKSGILPVAKELGISLPQLGAALDVFTLQGVPAEEAATKLRTGLIKMLDPSKEGAKALADMGIKSTDLGKALESGGLPAALDLLHTKFEESVKSMGKVRAEQDLLNAFGGSKTGGTILQLVDGFDQYNESLKRVNRTSLDYVANAAAAMQTTPYKIHVAFASLKSSLTEIGVTLAPVIAKIAGFIAHLGEEFDKLSPHTKKLIEIGIGVAAALGPVAFVVGSLTTVIGGLVPVVAALATPLGAAAAAVLLLGGAIAFAMLAPKQFQAVLEKMGLSAQDAKRVVDDLRKTFEVIKAVVEAVWPVIKAVVVGTLNVITAQVRIFSALFHGDFGKAFSGLAELARAQLMAVVGVAKAIGNLILRAILEPIGKLAAELGTKLWNAIKSAAATVAGEVVSVAEAIGKAIADGIVSGVGDLASSLAGKLWGGIKGAVGVVTHLGKIFSPSRFTAEQIGKPLAEGILMGFLEGSASLPSAMSETVRRGIEASANAVRAMQSRFDAAWQQLASDAMAAFDAETQRGLDAIDARLNATLAKIEAARAALTPAEATLADVQGAERKSDVDAALAQAQADVARTYAELQAAIASGNQQAIDQATAANEEAGKRLVQAERASADFYLQQQAERERKAADAKAKQQSDAATKLAATQKLNYEAERTLHRRHLDQWLTDTQAMLDKQPGLWTKNHNALMKTFKEKFGPDFHKAGANLGAAFVTGLAESFAQVEQFAQDLGKLLAKYLQGHSPPRYGPLSGIDKWWTSFPELLAGGFTKGVGHNFEKLALLSKTAFAMPALPGGAQLALAGAVGRGSAGGFGESHVHVHFHGGTFIGSRPEQVARELSPALKREFIRQRQSGLGFGTRI